MGASVGWERGSHLLAFPMQSDCPYVTFAVAGTGQSEASALTMSDARPAYGDPSGAIG